jgi:hypothetical protein
MPVPPEAGTPQVEPTRSRTDRSTDDEDRGAPDGDSTALFGEAHVDLVSETLHRIVRDKLGADSAPRETEPAPVETPPTENAPLEWRHPPAGADDGGGAVTPAPSAEGGEPEPDLEAERDKWRERAIVWRERALAADVVAKELGAHLADVRENLADVRIAMRALTELTEQRPALGAPSVVPRTGWRAYVARLLDLDH